MSDTQAANDAIVPIVLCGGSGTRLWPLSRDTMPKQFLALVSEQTFFQETLRRAADLGMPTRPPVVICHAGHASVVERQLREMDSTPQAILLEPLPRNTAPALAAAALLVQQQQQKGEQDPLLLVLPADHVVRDQRAFAAAVNAAVEPARAGYLVTFGVVPDRPETGYGYIASGERRGAWSLVEKFVEKPNLATAESYVASGSYLWNSGMFMFSAGTYLRELEQHAAATLSAAREALEQASADGAIVALGDAFRECPPDSIDYAVMEHTRRAAVVPLAAGWSDVGSWSALHDALEKDAHGNAVTGPAIVDGCRDTHVMSSGRLVAAIGLEGIVIVETPDAVLVVSREHAQSVKRVADALKLDSVPQDDSSAAGQ